MVSTTTVETAVNDFFDTVEALGDELQEWYDNMPENLQSGSKGDEVSEAAQLLQDLAANRDETPDAVHDIEFEYTPFKPKNAKKPSRSDRMQMALAPVNEAINAINAWVSEQVDDGEGEDDEQVVEVSQFYEELREFVETAESLEFPRMT